jgi:hypothetical protein
MKINLTHAAIGLGLLFIVYKVAKGNGGDASKGQAAPIESPAGWWSYAGSWGA